MRLIAPLLLLLLLMFAGTASATDYYVSTTGNNGASGDLTHPWQNVSYATQQAVAGDTIYLFDGTWYDEHVTFANSGNATHPITLTAYNDTPILDGVDKTGNGIMLGGGEYIYVSGLEVRNYYSTMGWIGNHCRISNCKLWNTTTVGSSNGVVIVLCGGGVNNVTIENCTLSHSGWNTIQVSGNFEPPNGNGIPATNITIRNCTIHDSHWHGAIDLFGNLQHVLIEGNTFYDNTCGNIYSHSLPDHREHIIIRDNTFTDSSTGVYFQHDSYVEIYNNTFTNIWDETLYMYRNCHDWVVTNNSFYNTKAIFMSGNTVYNALYDNNYIDPATATGVTRYGVEWYSEATIRNPRGKKLALLYRYGAVNFEWNDGTVFTVSKTGGYDSYTPPRYYPDKSNCSMDQGTYMYEATITPTPYNITLRPTYAYLKSVTVSHQSDAADDRTNLTVNSSVSTNPTWINATMQNSSNTYNVSIDGVYTTQVVSDANKIVRYQYTSSWSPHTFEFGWSSDAGFSGAPDPTNLANTTGETWVRHSWSAGSGNVTDSYNVSINSVWHNTTTNAYYNNTGLAAELWSNITIWAYNNTGGLSQNSLIQNTQSDAAAWAPSNTAMYYNLTSVITITTKTDGTNIFSRTPTAADGNATSGRLVVKTT